MNIPFFKMNGQGNDYIFVEKSLVENQDIVVEDFVTKICHRKTGIGADGVIFLKKPLENDTDCKYDIEMTIYNSDGSQAEMCGNGLRCVIAYLFKKTNSYDEMRVLTRAGIKTGYVISKKPYYVVKASLGKPLKKQYFDHNLNLEKLVLLEKFYGQVIDMGNVHFVVFHKEDMSFFTKKDLELITKYGSLIEKHKRLGGKTNVEFVHILSRDEVIVRVWEQGSGETDACGTGACAVLFAGMQLGLINKLVILHFPGGKLIAEYNHIDKSCYLTGEVDFVCEGNYYYQLHGE